MGQYGVLGNYTDNTAEFFVYDVKTDKKIGNVLFIYYTGDLAEDYVLTTNKIEPELLKRLTSAAKDLIKKEKGILV